MHWAWELAQGAVDGLRYWLLSDCLRCVIGFRQAPHRLILVRDR